MTAYREDMRALVAAARVNAAAATRRGGYGRDVSQLLKRAHRAGVSASGLTQEELAERLGVSQQHVQRFGSGESPDAPNTRHLVRAPDEYVDALMRELAAIRSELGHSPRQWLPAPNVEPVDDLERSMSVINHCANAQRAALLLQKPSASASELKLAEREFTEAAEALLEAVQRVRERLREAGQGR